VAVRFPRIPRLEASGFRHQGGNLREGPGGEYDRTELIPEA
jgi:hypothetical protein